MAKKKIDKVETPVIVAEVSIIRVEAPELLQPVVKEYGLELADVKVDSHLRTFLPFVSDLVDLETELNELLTGEITPELSEKAKNLRGKYRAIRTGSDDTKTAEKRDFVIEGRFLDKVNKTIGDVAKTKEDKCLEIEKHLENLENARITKLKEERKAALEALDYDTEFLNLAEMTEDSFNRLVNKAKTSKEGADALAKQKQDEADKQAEQDRKTKDHNERVQARISRTAKVGLSLDETTRNFTGEFGRIDIDVLEFFSDADFEKQITVIEGKHKQAEQDKADALTKEREAAQRVTNRMTAISGIGLTYNTAAERYEGWGQSIGIDDVKTLDAQEFKDKLDIIRGNVNDAKDKQKKKDDEAKAETLRLQKAEQQRKQKALDDAEALRLAGLAPDKDKFKAFYTTVKGLQIPAFSSTEGKVVSANIEQILKQALKSLQVEAGKLV